MTILVSVTNINNVRNEKVFEIYDKLIPLILHVIMKSRYRRNKKRTSMLGVNLILEL